MKSGYEDSVAATPDAAASASRAGSPRVAAPAKQEQQNGGGCKQTRER